MYASHVRWAAARGRQYHSPVGEYEDGEDSETEGWGHADQVRLGCFSGFADIQGFCVILDNPAYLWVNSAASVVDRGDYMEVERGVIVQQNWKKVVFARLTC